MSHDPYAPVGKPLSSSRSFISSMAPPPPPEPAPEPESTVIATDVTVTEDANGIEVIGDATEAGAAIVEAGQAAPSPEDVIAQQLAALDALRESE